jgi:hypothetical protein
LYFYKISFYIFLVDFPAPNRRPRGALRRRLLKKIKFKSFFFFFLNFLAACAQQAAWQHARGPLRGRQGGEKTNFF